MNDRDEQNSLFDAIGGKEAVNAIVHDAYERITKDRQLARFFEHVDMDRLRKMQAEFLTAALGGPPRYTGAELGEAHRHLKLTPTQFSRFVQHFLDAAAAHGVERQLLDDMLQRLAMYRDAVLGETNVDG